MQSQTINISSNNMWNTVYMYELSVSKEWNELKINVDHGRVVRTLQLIKDRLHILFSYLIAELGG
jgi:hypothetical protein